MAREYVTEWLKEKKPEATVRYHGADEDDLHRWELVFPGDDAQPFNLIIPEELLDDAGMLAERLMELESGGWLDDAGEVEHVLYVNPAEVARGPSVWE